MDGSVHGSNTEIVKSIDVVTVISFIGLWTPVLKHQVWYFGCCHLGILESEVTIFGTVEERGVGQTGRPRALSAHSH